MEEHCFKFLLMKKILIWLLFGSNFAAAAQSNTPYQFAHSLPLQAADSVLWRYWTHTDLWPLWDTGLKSATLQGDFVEGSRGKLLPDRGPAAKFRLLEVQPQHSYTFVTALPGAKLLIKRQLQEVNGVRYFTHMVWFEGPLANFWFKRLGKRYQALLPEVMEKLRQLCENPTA